MDKRVLKYIKKLKQDFPLSLPVKVRTVPNLKPSPKDKTVFGLCLKRQTYCIIWLNRDSEISVQIDTLWHEWTHLLLWPRCRYRHSRLFWLQYGQIYRKYLDVEGSTQ